MKRLIDMDGEEPLFQRGVKVIQKTPPTPDAPDVRARVWRSIQNAPATAPRGLRVLFPKLAMVAIVAFAAGTAGAMIGRRWIAPATVDRAPAPARATPARAPAETARAIPPAVPTEVLTDERPTPKPPARSAPKKVAAPPPSAASVARERTEVLDALVALRREHDPARAGTLLARYLSAHPRGALREEALALAIEAADARGDRPAGQQLAQLYQSEFPAGRFLIFARSHTDGSASH